MVEAIPPHLVMALEGAVGAVGFYLFMIWRNDYELRKNPRIRLLVRSGLGAFIGYLWFLQGLPNSFNTVMAGMIGPELIQGLIDKKRGDLQEILAGQLGQK